MKEPALTRNELRFILADPTSTQRQILEAKIVLGRRIANGADNVRQTCDQYHLTSEQTAKMLSSHQKVIGNVEDKAAEEVQELECMLEETRA